MINQMQIDEHEAAELLSQMAKRKKFYFDDLTTLEKLALNHKELIEDDYFIVLQHHIREARKFIEGLIPLNFFVNDDFDLVAYCEDDDAFWRKLPSDTTLTFNRI